VKRRKFIKDTSVVAGLSFAVNGFSIGTSSFAKDKMRLGFIGVGARGLGTLELALKRNDIEILAICDIDPITTAKAVKAMEKAGKKKPQLYTEGDYAYKKIAGAERY
jgi:predicted homoserine dehydrogenase-like protein